MKICVVEEEEVYKGSKQILVSIRMNIVLSFRTNIYVDQGF